MPKEEKQMTSVRLSVDSHAIIKLIKKRYKNEEITTQDDAFLEFIKEVAPDLYKEGLRIAAVRRELNALFEDDE